MIKTIFPVNILVKDFDMPEQFSNELSAAVQAIFQNLLVEKGLSRDQLADEEVPVFTETNIRAFPALKQLQDMFADGFFELASSFEENTLTKELISKMVSINIGKLPLMRKGDYKRIHGHTSSIAFGVFYLTDVDNEKFGGQLILKDPSFHSNSSFHPPEDYAVTTKKNRLVVAPAYVWHEVTPYTGDEERVTVVVNLHFDTVD